MLFWESPTCCVHQGGEYSYPSFVHQDLVEGSPNGVRSVTLDNPRLDLLFTSFVESLHFGNIRFVLSVIVTREHKCRFVLARTTITGGNG